MTVVAIVGGFTALFAASIGLLQNDIKRVLAYSTVSQLGYMFLACGVGAFTAGIFHLMTHAFFKALLFLGSGSVIHGLSGEQDMRKMGALRHHMPRTFITFVIATIAIAGIPPFAGFFSKDEILWQTFSSPNGHWILWLIGAVAAGMTAFYMSRLVFMTFFGESRVDEHAAHHLHESPNNMTVPLMILAFLSIVGGWVGIPAALGGNNHIHHFLEPSLGAHQGAATTVGHGAVAEVVHGATATGAHGVAETAHGAVAVAHGAAAHHPPIFVEYLLMLISIGIALGGIALAYQLYLRRPELPTHLSQRFSTAYDAILNKYYVDEIYAYLVINPTKRLCQALWRFDMNVVDGAVNGTGWLTVWNSITSGRFDTFAVDGAVNGISMLIKGGGRAFRRFHTGLVQNYALAMFLGIFFLVSLYLFS
jgi:NADH-quinone oxidoreductase subunit L